MAPHSTAVPFLGAPSQAGLGTSSQQKQEGEGKIKKPLERGLPPPADPAILTALPLAGASLPFSVSSTTSFFSFRSWKEQKSRRVTQIPADWVRQGADQVRKKIKHHPRARGSSLPSSHRLALGFIWLPHSGSSWGKEGACCQSAAL